MPRMRASEPAIATAGKPPTVIVGAAPEDVELAALEALCATVADGVMVPVED
jgi:hypothetical protein